MGTIVQPGEVQLDIMGHKAAKADAAPPPDPEPSFCQAVCQGCFNLGTEQAKKLIYVDLDSMSASCCGTCIVGLLQLLLLCAFFVSFARAPASAARGKPPGAGSPPCIRSAAHTRLHATLTSSIDAGTLSSTPATSRTGA